MIPKDGMNLQYLKAAFLRRFWYIVLPFFVVSIATVGYCIRAPRLYKSSATILVQPQEVPRDFVKPTVTTSPSARLKTVREQIMSRPRLEEIIKQHDLYPEVRAARTMYDAISVMRKHITVEVKGTQGRRDTAPVSFEVSYQGKDPAKVQAVAAAIADLFIEDNLKLRERQSAGTSKFLEGELERTRNDLRQKEELVRQFKAKHAGFLPEQMENNYRILAQLQQHLDSLNATLPQTEDRKVLLQTQLSRLEALQAGPQAGGDAAGTTVDLSQFSVDELRQQLQSLKSRYSDKHPDVLRLAAAIAKLEKGQEATVADTEPQGPGVGSRPSEARRLMLVQREDALTQLKLIDKQINTLTREKRQTSREIRKYRDRIEQGPEIDNMFVDLRRDYNQANNTYQSLLQKKLQAELAENLERSQKGEQLVILDAANLPQEPFKPNVRKMLSMGFMLALCCGLGLAFLREYIDPTFWRSKDLESAIELPVLVSIPVVTTDQQRRWNLVKKAGAAGAVASMASVLLYALFLLWKLDPAAFPIPIG